MHKILILDDDQSILKSLHRLLRGLDIDIYTSSCPQDAINLCKEHDYKLIISDQRMPSMTGTEFLYSIKQSQANSTRVLLSAHSDFNAVTEAFNNQSIHKFIPKPWDNDSLRYVVKSILEEDESPIEEFLVHDLELVEFHKIYTQCDKMLDLFDIIKRVATANVPINIYGETGTGKELIAHALHKESPRHNKHFVAINCANLTSELAESQLFGHKKGSFTGAFDEHDGLLSSAHGGTLFMDEVTCLPMQVQAKLLRALQEQEYYKVGTTKPIPFNVQLISASATSLDDAVKDGIMRADLRFRLEVLPIIVPVLAQRGQDIIKLFSLFLKSYRKNENITLSEALIKKLLSYDWPGNVRELHNAASYAHALTDGNNIGIESLPSNIKNCDNCTPKNVNHISPQSTLDKEVITEALSLNKGNRSKTADSLGISRMTLWRKMKDLNI